MSTINHQGNFRARMARTAHSIDSEQEAAHGERDAQNQILNKFLSKRGLS